ncbi:protein of unknown function DUF990 [Thermoanaerobacter mathranii subsp. mathranii str. A3]|jgi:ABC-2 type transport system permease protein|uniref:ABC transporter permease n=4 Tax=Thermoanaerobacter TaxID=1754 RepID=D3T6T2_THEIA|nr:MULTISPECIES: ABC-2 family transporter protein [Thermoanaerobacter]ADD01695.1 protein of unknown function DUF990 [Thermoanaerobacter italicus Ab9]ADH60223.1 protein of unknown function DUF990 [Thermoanaerobacter mathranii subsp. mathranii str. A3]EMT37895.1 ABC-type uncharacterized transport system, permease component [Thermoanaerobacter thermohydrosulfuricus WC1]MBT1279711.1 ABC-2 family transporter protein [Thermoanaerobacter sp. CM-CNRG TB177]MDP9749843.1 ABC-2 type transport system perm
METISTKARLGFKLIKIGFESQYIYRLGTFFSFLSGLLYLIMQYFLWQAIYHSGDIKQYSFNDIIFYIFLAQIISYVFPTDVSSKIAFHVRTGDIIHLLLKPVKIETQLFYESLGKSAYRLLINGGFIFIVLLVLLPYKLELTVLRFFQFALILLLSYVFVFFFELLMGIIAFYTTSTWGIQSFKYVIVGIFSGRLMPISLYPPVFRKIVDWLPFRIIYFTPIEFIMNKANYDFCNVVKYQTVSIALLLLLYVLVYRNALKKIKVQGG